MADQKTLSIENLVEAISENNTKMKAWVTTQINNVKVISIIWVDELPTTNISTSAIYLVKNEEKSKKENNIYDEYVYKSGIGWEILGQVDTTVDLSNYYTKAQVNAMLANIKVECCTDEDVTTIVTEIWSKETDDSGENADDDGDKNINKANLKLALSENNEKILQYVDSINFEQQEIIDKMALILDDINGEVV